MFIKLKKIIFLCGTRILILYLLAFIAVNMLVDTDVVMQKSRFKVLNRLRPATFNVWKEFDTYSKDVDKEEFERHMYYYDAVTSVIPGKADAFAMLGLTSYYCGKTKKAIAAFEKSVRLNPFFSGRVITWVCFILKQVIMSARINLWKRQ